VPRVNCLSVSIDEVRLDAVFADLNQSHLPGVAVGIAVDGQPVYRKGFGRASIELPVLLTPSMRLRIASASKQFTCLAYLLLCEDGKAGIDDPIARFFPELHAVARQVTVRQLMGNVSGLRDVYDIYVRLNGLGAPASNADLLALYDRIEDVNTPPSTTWCYNNGGWLLLTTIIEGLSGQSLETFMQERIFRPIGMHDSLVRRLDSDFVPNSATQHAKEPTGAFVRRYWGLDNLVGAGAIVSTVDDMLRWLAHMDRPKVGSSATWNAMKTSQRLQNNALTGYGCGLINDRYRGVETLWHGGNALGGNAQVLKVPAVGLDVMIFSNRQDASSVLLVERVLDVCLSGLDPSGRSSAPIATGVFHSAKTSRVLELYGSEGRQMGSINGIELPFDPDDEGVLRHQGVFREGREGVRLIGDPVRPHAAEFLHFGNVDELVAVKPVERAEPGAIFGHYHSAGTDTELTVFEGPRGPRVKSTGCFGSILYDLECLAEGIWKGKTNCPAYTQGVIFIFDSDGQTLRLCTYQTWALPFRRRA
jgi:D-aminopeptidase